MTHEAVLHVGYCTAKEKTKMGNEHILRLLDNAVVAAVVGALVGGLAAWLVSRYTVKKSLTAAREEEGKRKEQKMELDSYTALLFGRDIIFLLKYKRDGDEFAFERTIQGVREYLRHFQLINVSVPSDPTADGGAALTDFVNNVVGRLEVSNQRAAAALLLAWNGILMIDEGDPSMVHEYAQAAGFPPWNTGEKMRDYLTRLESRAQEIVSTVQETASNVRTPAD